MQCNRPSPAHPLAITPEVARVWLTYNYLNRNQRESGKRNYSSDMEEGNFAINGATITFSRPVADGESEYVPNGKVCLMDGQHRLQSCVQSGKPFVSYVVYGLSPDVRPTIDSGIKRTYADTLQLQGEKNANVLSSIIRRALAWSGGDVHLTLKRSTLTNSQLNEFFDQHPELRRSAEIATRTHHEFHQSTQQALRQSMIGFTHWLLMQNNEKLTPEFFERLGDGASMPVNHPIMHLRRRLLKDLTEKKQQGTRRDIPVVLDDQQLCYFIRTWNAYLLWTVTPEEDRAEFPAFAMVGSLDHQRIPVLKTLKEVEDAMLAQMEAKERKAAIGEQGTRGEKSSNVLPLSA
jgi:hypothetical protein